MRAAHSRRVLQENGLKARIADTLIAQSCIDHDVPLITRDRDFRHFFRALRITARLMPTDASARAAL
jgi:predicted nucleic acid-binding protein